MQLLVSKVPCHTDNGACARATAYTAVNVDEEGPESCGSQLTPTTTAVTTTTAQALSGAAKLKQHNAMQNNKEKALTIMCGSKTK